MAYLSLKALATLPDTWEVAIFPAPFEIQGMPLRGLLVVAETTTHRLRQFAPIPIAVSLVEVLQDAFLNPAPGSQQGRPRGLRVQDPLLLDELRPLLDDAGILGVVVHTLPATLEVLTTLMAQEGPQAPGLSEELDAWRTVLSDLSTLQPWRSLRDNVCFVFRGGILDGGVSVIIGHLEENRGILFYPSLAEYEDFIFKARNGQIDAIRMLAIILEPPEELSATERAACQKLNLVFSNRFHAKAYAGSESGFLPPTLQEQQTLLAATQAVTAVCHAHLSDLAAGISCTQHIELSDGVVTVEAGHGVQPISNAPPFITFNCQFIMTRILVQTEGAKTGSRSAMVLKMRKSDAKATIPLLKRVQCVQFVSNQNEASIYAVLENGEKRILFTENSIDEIDLLRTYFTGTDLCLVLSSGGPSRPNLRSEDVMAQHVVPVQYLSR